MTFTDIYNKDYCERYMAQANTELGKQIYTQRWELINKYVKEGSLLDYGSGPGAFNKMGSTNYYKFNYDINPHCGYPVIPELNFDIVTFWDSLEHIPNFYGEISKLNPKWLFISTPNLASVTLPVCHWKHYRPKEHLYYFDLYSLTVILETLNYTVVEHNFQEGYLRDPLNPGAIITVVAKRNDL